MRLRRTEDSHDTASDFSVPERMSIGSVASQIVATDHGARKKARAVLEVG
ncbi:hypothetical protein C4J85_2662 [Pseudomonas sp. R4-34-07]|nr:hypothetical protein C4J85_2662 [Pseudomonas sp. R4-34-07]